MIQPNELRIGNYIMFEQTTHIVVELSETLISTRWIKGSDKYIHTLSDLRPIPLTEDILLKCGFEYILPYNKKDNWEMKLGDYRDSQELKLDGSDVFPTFLSSSDLIEDGKGVHIAICKDSGIYIANLHNKDIISLHQLQNVYFALTGKELEVKL